MPTYTVYTNGRPDASFDNLDDLQNFVEQLEHCYTGTAWQSGTTEEIAAGIAFDEDAALLRATFPAGAILYRADGLRRNAYLRGTQVDGAYAEMYTTDPIDRLEAIRAYLSYVDISDEARGSWDFELIANE